MNTATLRNHIWNVSISAPANTHTHTHTQITSAVSYSTSLPEHYCDYNCLEDKSIARQTCTSAHQPLKLVQIQRKLWIIFVL